MPKTKKPVSHSDRFSYDHIVVEPDGKKYRHSGVSPFGNGIYSGASVEVSDDEVVVECNCNIEEEGDSVGKD